jgi:actin related protein 2/3 complex subunit 1A/1B
LKQPLFSLPKSTSPSSINPVETRGMSYQYLFLENGRPLPATCHAWNRDLSQIAFCPNSSTIRIHSVGKDGKLGELVQELVDHDKVVTSLSWGAANNRLVSCSQDRNAFVWSLDSSSGKFVPELVALRVKNSCTDVKWSPCERKFAVATGAKHVALCHFVIEDQGSGSGLWFAKHIGNHGSTVLSIDWHPSSCMLASGSSDQWCRIFMSAVKKIDAKPPPMFGLTMNKAGKALSTGDVLAEIPSSGWVHCVSFSPSGAHLAFSSHDSSIRILSLPSDRVPNEEDVYTLYLPGLPLIKLIWLNESRIVGAGHDRVPIVIEQKGSSWCVGKRLDDPKKRAPVEEKKVSAVSNAFKAFGASTTAGAGASRDSSGELLHQNCISGLSVMNRNASEVTKFSSIGTSPSTPSQT